MRRPLTAALTTLTLAAAAALGPAAAAVPDDDPSGLPAQAGIDATDKVVPALRDAQGRVTAFVQLDAPSALDVAESGGSDAAVTAAAADIEALADDVVPQASARARTAAPVQLSVTTKLLAGTIVTGEAAQVRALAASEDVVQVYLVTPKTPDNKGTDVFTRAIEAWEQAGGTGAGIRMGIIDTGVDYTHADFGGPGTEEAYAAAYGEDGTGPIPAGLFDPEKFLGGYDFAGTDYDAGADDPALGVPHPDPNPIDGPYTGGGSGHGTHVAGTAAGYGVTPDGETFRGDYAALEDIRDWQIGPGSAPEAGIYALKVFGDDGGSTNVTINALEWAADPNNDFDFNDRLDVVNLSLGAAEAPVDDPENLFIDQLARLGTIPVMSAGNSGDIVDVGGSPGNAGSALAVANSVGDTMTYDAIEVVDAANDALEGLHAAQMTVAYASDADVTAPVVYLGADVSGCTSLAPYAEQIAGNIVWLYWDDNDATRACGSVARWNNAQAAGAAGVLIGSELPFFSAGISGNPAVPGAQLTDDVTDLLLPEIQAGTLTVRLSPSLAGAAFVEDDTLADTLNSGSSRGAHGSLGIVKPDVAAPGTSISSAASGAGTAANTLSGTSMAAPHVAGIAANVQAVRPTWDAQEVKAAVINTATHDVYRDQGPQGPAFGPERVGAGRVDALDAVSTEVIAYDTENPASVTATFGIVNVADEVVVERRTITVENKSAAPASFDTAFTRSTATGGATIAVTPASITVQPGRTQTVTLTLTADPATLVREMDPTQGVNSGVGVPRDFLATLSGRLVLTPQGDEGGELRVPVHAAPRLVSDLEAEEPVTFDGPADLTAPLVLTGRGVDSGHTDDSLGWVSFAAPMALVAESPQLEESDVATSPSSVAAGDVRYVGFASTAPQLADAGSDPLLGVVGIGIAMQGEWPTLGTNVIPVIDTDVDSDGDVDLQTTIQKLSADDDVTVAVTTDLATEETVEVLPINTQFGNVDTTVFDNNVLVAPISVDLFEPGTVPTFQVWTFSGYAPSGTDIIDTTEEFTADPYAPDYWFDGGAPNSLLFVADDGTELEVHRAADLGEDPPPLLVLHTHNATPGSRAQVVDVVVEEPQVVATTTTLAVSGDRTAGEELTLTATVAPPEATGTVTFFDGATELGSAPVTGGTASITATLSAGSHTLTARFTPATAAFGPSTSAPVTVVVGQSASTTTLTLSDDRVAFGEPVTATVVVTGASAAPSGSVEIRVGGQVVATGTLVVDGLVGTATIALPQNLPVGRHDLVAVYAGSADVAGSTSAPARLVIAKAWPDVSLDADWRVPRGSDAEVTVTVSGSDGAPVPTGTVTAYANFRRIGPVTLDENGTAVLTIPAIRSTTVITVLYSGDAGYHPGLDMGIITVGR
ncbi:S8 family serine peptidase [Georgenia faecalis]|uniref:S8 family serine peptidase n=1 Tax=Georgenia faecalis TaxID=2483799 RepID=UPI000FD70129|nr:S8 family serine peptidase [Georgenia faecalis]